MRSLGADEVIDYTTEDFTKNGETYDVILDAVGKQSFRHSKRLAAAGWRLRRHGPAGQPRLLLLARWFGKRKVVFGMPRLTKENVLFVKELVEAGELSGGHRPDVSARGRRRGDEVRRELAEDGQRGPDVNGSAMRAVVHDRYGPPEVLRLEDVEKPVPEDDEVLVRIHATTVNRTDCGLRKAKPFVSRFFTGILRPKRRILGMELAGVVEGVGAAVTEFAVGDEVFGVSGLRRARGVRRASARAARSRTSRPA